MYKLRELFLNIRKKWSASTLSAIPILSWVMLVGIILFSIWTIRLFASLSDQYKATIIAFIGTVFAAVYAQIKAKQRENESRLFQQKSTAYKKMFDIVGNMFNRKDGDPEVDIVSQLRDFQKDLLIWGSERTIKAYNSMMEHIAAQNANPVDTALQLNNLFSELRKDLGHNDKNLSHTELIGIYIKPEDKQKFFNRDFDYEPKNGK